MMRNASRTVALLALASLLALSAAAFAGDNAAATFSLTTATEFKGVGPGATVDVGVTAAGMVGVKQFDITVEWSPADAIDIASSSFAANSKFGLSLPVVEEVAAGQGKVGAAALANVNGANDLGVISLVTSSTVTTSTTITVKVIKISIGPSSSVRDEFPPGEATILSSTITVNPPAPPVIEPTLTTTSPADVSLDFSPVGKGNVADASAGEVTFTANFKGNAGAAVAGQSIDFAVTNNGGEPIYILGTTVVSVASGTSKSVTVATAADGSASIKLDSQGGKTASSTSASVAVTTTATNSEGTSRNLSLPAFSASWNVPVAAELASFVASVAPNRDVLLEWTVASQSNNLGWEVYRSVDGVRFEKASGLVAGDGTTDQLRNYSAVDMSAPEAEVVYYYLKQIDLDGSTARSSVIEVALSQPALPTVSALWQNYPNPFNPETTIGFDLSGATVVRLAVYDATGQVVRTVIDGQTMAAGHYRQAWDGRNDMGAKAGSGVYFYRLQAGDFTSVKKMTLVQ